MALDQIPSNDKNQMSFLEHLEELRWHIIRGVAAIILGMIIVFLAKDFVFKTVLFGPMKSDFITYRTICGLSEWLCFAPSEFGLRTQELGEEFIVHLKSSFWLGLILAFPIVIWEIWRFIKPGLHKREINATQGVVFVCSFLFLLGVLFGYYIISPFGITFLAGYDVGVTNAPTLSSYVNYMTMFTLPAGVIFELPVVIYFLAKMRIVSASAMRKYRKHAVIGILVVASIITPPDMVTQMLIGVPLYILYELSIFIAQKVNKEND